ncbi:hypothetical protein [Rhizobium sp. L51/94]|uniref:hypothetical protein n=1 Tax=Rhizobium sp. L51/94 TaxID=2819999 RepID=UPI001C5B55DD|nr:hypothetical protein [Rhizobium sp. L51/94]QXZ79673.1 hypothetical protein J5274_06735 [Rhizobium sp. L51/94]
MVNLAVNIWADGPSSAPLEPFKADIREWGTWIESFLASIGANSGSVYTSRSSLYADLAHAANSMAWVIGDATAAYNGIYTKLGGSGAGSWSRIADLPYSFVVASDAGTGSPNAIQATTPIPVSPSQIIVLSIFENNDSSPVTIAFNGGSPLTVKDFQGKDVVQNELIGGSVVTGVIKGSTFRLLYDQNYPYAKATNTGAGTADAIQATIPVGVDFNSSNSLISVNVVAPNTTTTPTIAFNGGSALAIKTNSGNSPVVGGLVGNLLGFVSGSTFRLISDQASAAILAGAEAAEQAASDYADFARNNWAVMGPFTGTGVADDLYPLTIDPGSANNMFPIMGRTAQMISTGDYGLVYVSGAPKIKISVPLGVLFEVRVSNAIPIGTPPDGSVTEEKHATGGVSTRALANNAATYAKMQAMSALRLLGSVVGGIVSEITPAVLRDSFFPIGSVIDSVSTTYASAGAITTIIPADNSVPQIGEGTMIMSLSITPKSTSNKLRLRVSGIGSCGAVSSWAVSLFKVGTANALDCVPMNTKVAGTTDNFFFEHEFVPASTTLQSFQVNAGPGGATSLVLNLPASGAGAAGAHCTFTIDEIKA